MPADEKAMEMEPEKRKRSPEPKPRGRLKKRFKQLAESTSSEAESDDEVMHALNDTIQVTLLPGVAPSIRGSEGSARWDCRANQSVTLQPGQTTKVDLRLWLATPARY